MRGEVLHYDESQGFGFINGADGNHYTFRREDMRQTFQVSRGTPVEFRESGGQAHNVSPISVEASASTTPMPSGTTATSATAAPATAAVPRPQHFGRFAVAGSTTSSGLWSYFWTGMTTNYVNFRDRARRKEYWGFVLFFFLALIALLLVGVWIDYAFGNMQPGYEMPVATIVLCGLFMLAGIVPGVAVSVRRFHDIGLSGWFYLLFFVLSLVTVGGLIIFVIALLPSQKHDNKWGPVPVGIAIPPLYSAPATPGTSQ